MPDSKCDEKDGVTSGCVRELCRGFLVASREVLGLDEFIVADVLFDDIYVPD